MTEPYGAWRRARLRESDANQRHPVGWLELFFDLVFVVIVSALATNLVEGRNVGEFILQFVAVFWVWNAFTYYTERFESGGIETRLFTFLGMLTVAGLAVWGHDGLGVNYVGFALSYLLARTLNIALWLRAGLQEPRFRRASLGFFGGYLVAVALLTVSFFVGEQARLILWGTAVLIEILTPAVTGRFQAGLPPITEDKFPERFGLFTMIVLGETVAEVIQGLAAANSVERLTPLTMVCAALGLAIGFGMWWVYYDFVARRPVRQQFYIALAWVYLHMVMLIGIVLVGTGIAHGLDAAGAPRIDPFAARLLFSGLGIMLLSVAVIETTLVRASDEPTHPIVSPVLKAVVAVILFGLALVDPPIPTALAFALAIAALAVQSTYGAIVWYRPRPQPA